MWSKRLIEKNILTNDIVRDGKTIFVSTASGNDSNNGLTKISQKKTIAGAITACVNAQSYEIVVEPGVYDEDASANGVTVNKNNVIIRGEGTGVEVTNTTTSTGYVFNITGNNVILKNMSIYKDETTSDNSSVVKITGINCVLSDVSIIVEKANHIGLEYAAGAKYCNMSDGPLAMSFILGASGTGIGIKYNGCTFCASSRNVISHLTTGVIVDGDDNYLLEETTIDKCTTGLSIVAGSENNFLNAKISDNCTNRMSDLSGNATNDFFNNTGYLSHVQRHVPKYTGDIYYVDTVNGLDTNIGLSVSAAFKTITKALSVAGDGDSIRIGYGTYSESNLEVTQNGMLIECEWGVFIGNSGAGAQCFIVSGDKNIIRNAIFFDSDMNIYGVTVSGDFNILENCQAETCTRGFNISGSSNVIERCISNAQTLYGFYISGSYNNLTNTEVNGLRTNVSSIGYYISGDYNISHECRSVNNVGACISLAAGADFNTFYQFKAGGADGGLIDAGDRNAFVDFLHLEANFEKTYPVVLGEGAATVSAITVDNLAKDETHSQDDRYYWGEPFVIIQVATITTPYLLLGFNFFCNTTNRLYRCQLGEIFYRRVATKNGGVAWDAGATVLTVDTTSEFLAGDYVMVQSSGKASEIVKISTVDSPTQVTIVRETNAWGGTGLRWNHTTAGAGSEKFYLVRRPNNPLLETTTFDLQGDNAQTMLRCNFTEPRMHRNNAGVYIRAIDMTSSNAGNFDFSIVTRYM